MATETNSNHNSQQKRVALITGASSGIGASTASLLFQYGYQVFGTFRNQCGELEQSNFKKLSMDITDETSIKKAIEQVIIAAGRIDALVNNAGIFAKGSIEETGLEHAKQLFETNFFGMAKVTQEVLPIMRLQKNGRIVNISSIVGRVPAPFMGYYCASKHAVEGYTETLDYEVSPLGIRAVIVEPGFTRTQISKNALNQKNYIPDYEKWNSKANRAIEKQLETGIDPIEVAHTILKALTCENPRNVYQVGRQASQIAFLRRILPNPLFSRGLKQEFDLND